MRLLTVGTWLALYDVNNELYRSILEFGPVEAAYESMTDATHRFKKVLTHARVV